MAQLGEKSTLLTVIIVCIIIIAQLLSHTSAHKKLWKRGIANGDYMISHWGTWGSWSACSRTCGGGVTEQTRHCLRRRMGTMVLTGAKQCVGLYKQYKLCSTKACHLESDFRTEQCEKFNYKRFMGKRYQWEPFIKASSPCELNCRAKGNRFYVKLADKVVDGTSCGIQSDSEICVDGMCKTVGCDGVLGSGAVVDKCGVCGGANTDCQIFSGLLDDDYMTIGYHTVVTIPAGAMYINVTEMSRSRNYLGLQISGGDAVFNGNWRIDYPGNFSAAGTNVMYSRSARGQSNRGEEILIKGPTVVDLDVMMIFQQRNPGIFYEYVIPNPRTEKDDQPTTPQEENERQNFEQTLPETTTRPSRPETRPTPSAEEAPSTTTARPSAAVPTTTLPPPRQSLSSVGSSQREEKGKDDAMGISTGLLPGNGMGGKDTPKGYAGVMHTVPQESQANGDAQHSMPHSITGQPPTGSNAQNADLFYGSSTVGRHQTPPVERTNEGSPLVDTSYSQSGRGSIANTQNHSSPHDSSDSQSHPFYGYYPAQYKPHATQIQDSDGILVASENKSPAPQSSLNLPSGADRLNSHPLETSTVRPEGRPEARPDTRPEIRPDTRPNARPDTRPNPTPDTRPDTRPNARPDTIPNQRPDTRPNARPDIIPNTRPDTRPYTRPDTRPNPRPNTNPNTRPDTRPYIRPDTRPNTRPNSRPDTRPNPRPDTRPNARPDTIPDTRPDTRLNPRLDTRPYTRPDAGPDTRPDARPNTRPNTRPNERPETRPDTGPYTSLETRPDPRPQTSGNRLPSNGGHGTFGSGINLGTSSGTFNTDSGISDISIPYPRPPIRYPSTDGTVPGVSNPYNPLNVRPPNNPPFGSSTSGSMQYPGQEPFQGPNNNPVGGPNRGPPRPQTGLPRPGQGFGDPEPTGEIIYNPNYRPPSGQSGGEFPSVGQRLPSDGGGISRQTEGTASNPRGATFGQGLPAPGVGHGQGQQFVPHPGPGIGNYHPSRPNPGIPADSTVHASSNLPQRSGGVQVSYPFPGQPQPRGSAVDPVNRETNYSPFSGGNRSPIGPIAGEATETFQSEDYSSSSPDGEQDNQATYERNPEGSHAPADSSALYIWMETGLTECSVSCAGGIRETIVQCVRENSFLVADDGMCDETYKPAVRRKTCNNEPCPPEWSVGEWGACSRTCGAGWQMRLVTCQQKATQSVTLPVAVDRCVAVLKPPTTQACSSQTTCSTWQTGSWSSCSAQCGDGLQQRQVVCVDEASNQVAETECSHLARPPESQSCRAEQCRSSWFTGNWSRQCSAECGSGTVSRGVVCSTEGTAEGALPDDRCGGEERPRGVQSCSEVACGPKWFTSEWSRCSVECGAGTQTRDVICVSPDPSMRVLPTYQCSVPRPANSQPCSAEAECGRSSWFASAWSECSKSCGGGQQTRYVKCLDGHLQPSSACETDDRPTVRQSCNIQRCKAVDPPDASCVDNFSYCDKILQARLCSYSYYRQRCCYSCYDQ